MLTRYSLDLELSCETRIVEKIGREMDLGGRTCREKKEIWFDFAIPNYKINF